MRDYNLFGAKTLCFTACVVFVMVLKSCLPLYSADIALDAPGVLMTFDDRNMINWEKHIPLFEKYGARCTFFVDRFDQLTPEQVASLKHLRGKGHTIGCHGLRHRKAAEFIKEHSAEKYLAQEIEPALDAMKQQGFEPMCFAYPNSNRNTVTDTALFAYFDYMRGGGSRSGVEMKDNALLYTPIDSVHAKMTLPGASCHPHSLEDEILKQAFAAMDRAKQNSEILVLYAHDIRENDTEGPKNYITPDALEAILKHAVKIGLEFYGFGDLP